MRGVGLALVACLLGLGCGDSKTNDGGESDAAQVQRVAKTYMRALARRDWSKACALSTAHAKRVEISMAETGRAHTCEAALEENSELNAIAGTAQLGAVDVRGRRADITVKPLPNYETDEGGPLTLIRTGAGWRVNDP